EHGLTGRERLDRLELKGVERERIAVGEAFEEGHEASLRGPAEPTDYRRPQRPRWARSSRSNSSGASRLDRCPAPSMIASRLPGIRSAIWTDTSGGISASAVDVMTSTGTSIADRSGVESGCSAIPSEAAAIASAGWSAMASLTHRRGSALAVSESSAGGCSTRKRAPSARSRSARARRAAAPSSESGAARVLARTSPANRWGARLQSSNATYPPMDRPPTTARSRPAWSSASSARSAAAAMVSTGPARGVPPKPGKLGATVGSSGAKVATCRAHIRASSGNACRSKSPSLTRPLEQPGPLDAPRLARHLEEAADLLVQLQGVRALGLRVDRVVHEREVEPLAAEDRRWADLADRGL